MTAKIPPRGSSVPSAITRWSATVCVGCDGSID